MPSPAGTPCGDQNNSGCDAANTCNGLGSCIDRVDPGTCLIDGSCQNDGEGNPDNECEICNHATNRTGWSWVDPGTACEPPIGGDCVDSGACFSGTCETFFQDAGSSCLDDDDPCTDDLCNDNGECVHSSKPGCCNDDAACDDFDVCTDDACVNGACSNTDKDCDDGVACTDEGCDAGTCTNTDNCTAPETCNLTSGLCEAVTPCVTDADCDDSEPCTDDLCDETGQCSYTDKPGCLDEGCFDDVECDDSNLCTDDTCQSGFCDNAPAPDGTSCGNADEIECGGAGTCSGGICSVEMQPAGTPCLDDGDPCTDDACDGNGVCIHPTKAECCDEECCSDFQCDDRVFCNGAERCQEGACGAGASPCADNDCDELNRRCGEAALTFHVTVQTSPRTETTELPPVKAGESVIVSVPDGPGSPFVFAHWVGDVPTGHERDDPLVLLSVDKDKFLVAVFELSSQPRACGAGLAGVLVSLSLGLFFVGQYNTRLRRGHAET